ncbi:hypothetical protein [Paraglaciecola chathamensis]|uniref:Uncharacterized protein n=1 Tax=Paraglaciecola agarilytica NO2 TaxID=1125747 RepID=A0ABQ0I1U1_9ALTE|nr:hypothetical protein [Paraglaciecola agarilytica]GAC03278.1 hypothetical protein GAGA_0413 [Paraglaciecola agarilytica NO2]
MKRYTYENTVKQQADVLCYAFSPDLIDASEKELKQFLQVLCQHFPVTENGGGLFKPMDNLAYINTFNNAYSNIYRLIEAKSTKKRHWQMLWLALLTLVVLAVTLGHDIYIEKQSNNEQSASATLNKSKRSNLAKLSPFLVKKRNLHQSGV